MNYEEIKKKIEIDKIESRNRNREILLKGNNSTEILPNDGHIIKELVRTKSKTRTIKIFLDKGYTNDEVEKSIINNFTKAKKEIIANNLIIILSGIILISLGILFSVLTFNSSRDGTFYIFYGAVIWGLFLLFKGLFFNRKTIQD